MPEPRAPGIYVLAGTNGAGKSSIAGVMFQQSGAAYFNPDAAALLIAAANPRLSTAQANAEAWQQGRRLLERAMDERLHFAFETTLGGNTIPALLAGAAASGVDVRVWYVGLSSPELHIARVRARVRRGGHDIPESRIRDRYDASRRNLIRLLPGLAELRLYDNSVEADPHAGIAPRPQDILHVKRGRILRLCDPARTPQWAKPIVAAAIQLAHQ